MLHNQFDLKYLRLLLSLQSVQLNSGHQTNDTYRYLRYTLCPHVGGSSYLLTFLSLRKYFLISKILFVLDYKLILLFFCKIIKAITIFYIAIFHYPQCLCIRQTIYKLQPFLNRHTKNSS